MSKNIINIKNILFYACLVVIVAVMSIMLYQNNKYNKTERAVELNNDLFDGKKYVLNDISVEITTRGGDAGAWLKDPIYDDEGNMLHGASVGTIYEIVITNDSKNIIQDWTIKVPVHELMWLNNSWDSDLEVHQDVKGEEKVFTIDLADYSSYDITLDYYMDHTGPMIPMYDGDYFIYIPSELAKEKPISSVIKGEENHPSIRFGFIMYIPDQTIDYVTDFSGAEIKYYMYSNPLKKAWFWVLVALVSVWLICLIIIVIVKLNLKKILEQQKAQKKHDEKMIKQTMQIIISLIESKDTSTKGHSLRVARYARKLAAHMGLNEDECMDVYYIGLMHDCGKLNIPDEILKNPGKLSNEEYEVMKKHTTYGGDILKDFSSITDIYIGAKYHHERFDGKGYPQGLAGEDIPLIARIIGVADAFDAMNSKRCYRDKLSSDVILKELKENRGKQFDPNVVDHMLELIDSGEVTFD